MSAEESSITAVTGEALGVLKLNAQTHTVSLIFLLLF